MGEPTSLPLPAVELLTKDIRSVPTASGSERQTKILEGDNGYVLSLVRRGRQTHMKLHYLGQCHLVPGIDYLRYEWLGSEKPDLSSYDSLCTRCWPGKDLSVEESSSTESD